MVGRARREDLREWLWHRIQAQVRGGRKAGPSGRCGGWEECVVAFLERRGFQEHAGWKVEGCSERCEIVEIVRHLGMGFWSLSGGPQSHT